MIFFPIHIQAEIHAILTFFKSIAESTVCALTQYFGGVRFAAMFSRPLKKVLKAAGPALVILSSVMAALAGPAHADEVDDVISKQVRNRDKVKHFKTEVTVETDQPAIVRKPKKTKMHFRMNLTRLPPNEVAHASHPWLMEAEVIEPHVMKLRVRGEQAWFLDHRGNWTELPMSDSIRERFGKMPERFLGGNPAEQRKQFGIKVLRHNNPI